MSPFEIAGVLALIFLFLALLAGAALLLRQTRLLAICPNVEDTQHSLIARTSLKGAILTLGLTLRRVVLLREVARIDIDHRYLWLLRSHRSIEFSDVKRVIYSYDDISGTTSWSESGSTCDHFSVQLKLANDELVHLFHFFGAGQFQRGSGTYVFQDYIPDWWFWPERTFDPSGSQESESRQFIDQLAEWLDVPVGPS